MSRSKIIPDATVYAAIHQLLADGGDKAVAFSTVARMTKLAAPTLVQRYGSRDGMVRAALLAGWDRLDAETAAVLSGVSDKGVQGVLKALDNAQTLRRFSLLAMDLRDPALRARAADWRNRIEAALALRLTGGEKGQEAASILFALWQGQRLWHDLGGPGFRLKDAIKRLG